MLLSTKATTNSENFKSSPQANQIFEGIPSTDGLFHQCYVLIHSISWMTGILIVYTNSLEERSRMVQRQFSLLH